MIATLETLSNENIILAFVKTRLPNHEMKIANEIQDTSVKVLCVEAVDENSKNNIKSNK